MLLRIALALIVALGAGCVLQTWRLHVLQTSVAQQREAQREADRMAERRLTTEFQRIDHDAATRRDEIAAAAGRAAAAGNGLRIAAAEAGATASTCGSEDATAATGVLAELPGRMEEAGRAVAQHAVDLAEALAACQSAYAAAERETAQPGTE